MCWSKRGGYLQIAPPFWINFHRYPQAAWLPVFFAPAGNTTSFFTLRETPFFSEQHFFHNMSVLLGSSIKNDQNRLSMTETTSTLIFQELLKVHWSGQTPKKTPTFFDVEMFGGIKPNFPFRSLPKLGGNRSHYSVKHHLQDGQTVLIWGWTVDSVWAEEASLETDWKSVHEKKIKLLFRSCWRRLVGWLGKRDFPN